MRRVFIVVVALTMLLGGAVPGLANNTWNGYHWANGDLDPHNGSISLTLVDHLTDPYSDAYSAVLDDWDGVPGPLDLTSFPGSLDTRPTACDNPVGGEIHVCNKEYGKNGWLGLARIWVTDLGHIEAGVALMNDSYLLEDESVYNNPVAWRHVLCQEVGHTFGLDHQGSPKNKSCMNDRWGLTDQAFESPNQHDYDTLKAIYGPADGGSGKPCNPKKSTCPSGANVHYAPRAGGGWVITYTFPPGRNLG